MKSDKDAFLDKYNLARELDVALDKGINASVQHNSLYRVGLPPKDRKTVRCEWKTCLCELTERYKSAQSVKNYENDIEEVKMTMDMKLRLSSETRAIISAHRKLRTVPVTPKPSVQVSVNTAGVQNVAFKSGGEPPVIGTDFGPSQTKEPKLAP